MSRKSRDHIFAELGVPEGQKTFSDLDLKPACAKLTKTKEITSNIKTKRKRITMSKGSTAP